jgi:2-phosphoglycerate kinase
MTVDEAFSNVLEHRFRVIYLGGKTSTGKSTFANRLKDSLDYRIVELDQVLFQSLVQVHNQDDEGHIFIEVYKLRQRLDWIEEFVSAVRLRIEQAAGDGDKLVVEGAIAHPDTLKELLRVICAEMIFYFHPRNLDIYERNLTNRFMRTNKGYNAGLPQQFWRLVQDLDFEQFCIDRILTDKLKLAIHEIALESQRDSEKRLANQSKVIPGMIVIDV